MRTLHQLEFVLKPEVWGGESCELRLAFIDRYLNPDDSSGFNLSNSNPNANLGLNVHQSGSSGTSSGTTNINTTTSNNNGGGGTSMTSSSSSNALGAAQVTGLLMTLEVLRVLFTYLVSFCMIGGHCLISFKLFLFECNL